MYRHITTILACILGVAASAQGPAEHPFSLNKGQWPKQVLYRAPTGHGALFVERDALTYVVRSGGGMHAHDARGTTPEPAGAHAYRVTFVGGHAGSHRGLEQLPHYENYFIGNDRSRWADHVPVHADVQLNALYPGIDLLLLGKSELEYDFLLAPGADADAIAMRFDGQDKLALEEGGLVITTTAGEVRERKPLAWQVINGEQQWVACNYTVQGNVVRFAFPNGYDKRYALTIDPVLSFCSFTGSTADNFGFTATYDASGHLYGGGIVFGVGYPVTLGVQQGDFAGGTIDIGLTKFTPDGSQLVWSTYLGGSFGNESPHSLVVNSNDELYVMGITGSSDFPTTNGCFDSSFGAGPAIFFTVGEGYVHNQGTDILVAHLSADASTLIGSTYVGGSQADGLNNSTSTAYNYGDPFRGEIVLDHLERPVVASCTMSSDIPTTSGAPFPTFLGGEQDGYVFAMDPALTTQLWSTFYGGSGTDACYSVQLDRNDAVFVTGGTNSTDLGVAGTPFIASAPGGIDGFVARFAPDGSALQAATYLGTAAYDQAYFVQLDTNNAVFVVGQTHGDYPITPDKYNVPNSSQFIQKLDHDLSTSVWSTRIGSGNGDEDISPSAFLVSDCGQIYFSGWGGAVNSFQEAWNSTTFGLPTTSDALQTTTDGSDFYLMVLDQEATGLYYATFFGGPLSDEHVDGGTSRFSKTGVVYQAVCAGCGGNSDLPTTPGAWSNTNNSFNCNLGVFKIDFELGVSANFSASPFIGCAPDTVHFTSTGSGTSWHWDFGDGSPPSTAEHPAHYYAEPGTYPVQLIAIDSTSCNISDTLTIPVVMQSPQALAPFFLIDQGPCGELAVTFTNTTPGVGHTFLWNMGDGNTYTTTDVTHTYAHDGTYTVSLHATDTLCGSSADATRQITIAPPEAVEALFTTSPADICSGLVLTAVSASTGPNTLQLVWNMGDGTTLTGNTVTHTYASAGTYTIALTAFDPVCHGTSTFTQEVTLTTSSTQAPGTFTIPNVFSPNGDAVNDSFFPIAISSDGTVHLQVFNRWGMKVYDTGERYKPWDGNVRPGEQAPEGVYYYLIDHRLPCSGEVLQGQQKGTVQLLR